GVPTAVGVHGGTGAIFAVVKAKPYWFSGLFPIIFLVSALASGAALLTFLYAFFGRREEGFQETLRGLAQLLALFIGVDLLMVASDFLVHLYGAIPEVTEVLRAIIAGPYWYTFWGGQIFLGAVVPLLILALPGTRRSTACLGLAGLSAVAGIVGVRLNLVIPAYIHPLIRGLEKAYQGPRLSYSYFPSGWEWASSVGIIAFVALLFSIAFEFLPMQHQRGARP
ncbi:MAG: NrfD/PsrC family molybdoenzyme membrane anchor subunit, partial [Nitrospinota bacterium]